MLTSALGVLAVLGSGVTAGVLFAVALSVVPALAAMPPDRYVYTHRLLGRYWDPTMPAIVLGSTAVTLVLAFRESAVVRELYIVAAVLLFGVSVVSHLCNVPINRRVKGLDPSEIPPGWADPRALWRNWHLTRTTLAVVALLTTAVAAVLI